MIRKKIAVLFIIFTIIFINYRAYAEDNPILTGSTSRPTYGSNYWITSNLREWLNSDKDVVQYTNNPPTVDNLGTYAYDKEKGFLTNFTEAEKNAIAVTRHRVYLASLDTTVKDGGSYSSVASIYSSPSVDFSLPYLKTNHNNYCYKIVNDKVFLLNDYELYEYIQKRGLSFYKTLTPEAKAKHSYYNDSIKWFICSPTHNVGLDYLKAVDNNDVVLSSVIPKNAYGIVPAMHLKPNITVNGINTSNLKIGDVFNFGKYLGSPIKWRVINKTPEGYVLIITENIIDIKPYDAPGDYSYANSQYINFHSYDIDISQSTKYTTENGDTTLPTVTILNSDMLNQRQNNIFTINMQVSDSGSGIKYVILPDNNIVYSNTFSYTITENKLYLFKVVDNAGNYYYYILPINNINPEPKVIISSSADGWTNKNVTVDIYASIDKTDYTNTVYSQNTRDWCPYTFPNFTTYAGKRFRITGSVELVNADKDVGSLTANIGFYLHNITKSGNEYIVNHNWIVGKSIPLKTLQQQGEQSFDFIMTIPTNYFKNLTVWLQMPIEAYERAYTIRWKNIKYELLDKEDIGIEKIILPNGQVIYSNQYTDVLTEEGNYTYKVFDSRGKITEKTITVLIDKVNPTINIDYNNSYTNDKVVLNINANDDRSGVKEVQLPNGSTTNQLNFTYNINANGSYTFLVKDNAGNITSKTLNITNIDKNNPSLTLIKSNNNWTNQDIIINVIATDDSSGVKRIKLPNGQYVDTANTNFVVNKNGLYTFEVEDNAGNKTIKNIQVNNIDKINPIINYSLSVTNWTNQNVNIILDVIDNESGIKSIKLPNGNIVTSNQIEYAVGQNGNYIFEIEDNAGNKVIKNISVSNIDKDKPFSPQIVVTPNNWTNNNVSVTIINKGDNGSGVREIHYKLEGAVSSGWIKYEQPFIISSEGITTIKARAVDNVNNYSDEATEQAKIDRTPPENNLIKIIPKLK